MMSGDPSPVAPKKAGSKSASSVWYHWQGDEKLNKTHNDKPSKKPHPNANMRHAYLQHCRNDVW
jgi:hypothetical protein